MRSTTSAGGGHARGALQRQGLLRPAQGAPRGQGGRGGASCASNSSIPFPAEEYEAILRKYPNAREIVWCQEEPQNQGAWYQIRHRLQCQLGAKHELLYAGRAGAAAPATGIAALHEQQQKNLVDARRCRALPPEETLTANDARCRSTQTRTGS